MLEEKISELEKVVMILNDFICDVETSAMFAAKCRMFKKHALTQVEYLKRLEREKAQNPELNFNENVSQN